MTASDNGLSLGIRLLPGETAARLDEYLRDAKGSFVSFLGSVHTAPVEFALDFDASESRCMEATGLVWSIDPVYCIASILVSDGEYSFGLSRKHNLIPGGARHSIVTFIRSD
ncbi:MAG TPA: hypothetical protein VFS89_06230 [Nitrosospira sp.]|nr:hypothetical protein [Nitrosospira sp.]